MGSTIACTGMAYMAVGGMPKKKSDGTLACPNLRDIEKLFA